MSVSSLTQLCAMCGRAIRRDIGQSVVNGQLHWHVSEYCTNCDYTVEIDGLDAIEQPYRDAVYAQGGIWSLALEWHVLSAPQFLQIIRLFGLSAGEFMRLKAESPNGIGEYTAFEAEYYLMRLAEIGVSARPTQRVAGSTA